MKKSVAAIRPHLVGWRIQLRQHLRSSIRSSRFKKLDPDWREGALDGIVTGVRFCANKILPIVSSVLARDFDMESENRCLLAKAGGGTLREIRKRFRLTLDNLEDMECTWHRCSPSDSSFITHWTWEDVANFLWRATGRFFKAHPKFGVK